MSKKRLLITGVSGLLGSSLAYALRDEFDILGLFHAHPYNPSWIRTEKAGLTSPQECERVVRRFRPDVCIHCAALADIDCCEFDRQSAYRDNIEVTRFLTDALLEQKSKLVFISTDAVYSGEGGNFREDDPVRPLNYYAETKLQAEGEAARCPHALIVRTSFFGWSLKQGKASLTEWAFNELSAGRNIRGFTDIITSSLYTFDLANILSRAIAKDLAGIFNFASANSISKYDLFRLVARLFGLDENLIEPVSVDQFPLKVRRSKNLGLLPLKLSQALGMALPTVEQGLERFYCDRQLPAQIRG